MGKFGRIWQNLAEFEMEEKEKKEEEEEKIPYMCKSMGHRPLRGHCPKVIVMNEVIIQVEAG